MDLSDIAAHPSFRRAAAELHEQDEETVREQLRIVSIPAPSFQEQERARYVESRFRELGLQEVHGDAVGNVLARVPGTEPCEHARGAVMVAAHLDTVFPAGTDLTPRLRGSRISAPGITDNARGLAGLLALARLLARGEIRPRRPIWLVATVGEEGVGDLRGTKHLFRPDSAFRDVAAFVSLDGSGMRRIVHRAVGSRRLRATLRGPGGHSWSDFGLPNPVHALGAGIAQLRRTEVSAVPASTLTVARVGGGTSVNSIPAEAWLELDLRSEAPEPLRRMEAAALGALQRALDEENRARRAGTPPLSLEVEIIGDRPSGSIAAEHPLVRAAVAATRVFGVAPELVASSTDANVPISLGIPAVTIGAGGEAGGVHTLEEWYENSDGARGLERALLLVLGAAGLKR